MRRQFQGRWPTIAGDQPLSLPHPLQPLSPWVNQIFGWWMSIFLERPAHCRDLYLLPMYERHHPCPYILQGSTVIYLKTFGNSCKAIVCWCVIQCVCVCAPSASAIVLYELNFEDSTWSFKFGGRGFMTIIPSSDCQLFAVINILNASEDFDCRGLDNVQTNETKYSPSQCTLALSSVNRFWNNKHKKPVHIKYKTKITSNRTTGRSVNL